MKVFHERVAVDVLSGNAGVGTDSVPWETTHAGRQEVLRVNLWGVMDGIAAFVPRMISQRTAGHVDPNVNGSA